jgi:hypothetical protein
VEETSQHASPQVTSPMTTRDGKILLAILLDIYKGAGGGDDGEP